MSANREGSDIGESPGSSQTLSFDQARTDPAFSDLYRDSYSRLVAQIAAILGSVEESEDVVQEAFARAAMRWLTISQYDVPAAWVRRVSINLAISRRRKAMRLLGATRSLSVVTKDMNAPGPEETQEVPLSLMSALSQLPIKYRAAIVLHHLADLDVAEVADILQISPNTVKTHLARGRARLRAVYSAEFSRDLGGTQP